MNWLDKMLGKDTDCLPLEDYLAIEHGRNKEWRKMETDLEQAKPRIRKSYWEQLQAAWAGADDDKQAKLLDVAVAITHPEFLDAALYGDVSLAYQRREAWWKMVDKVIADLPDELESEVADAGLDLTVLAGYICRDRQLFGFGGDARTIREVLRDSLTAGKPISAFSDMTEVNELIEAKGWELREADARMQVPEAVRQFIEIRLRLDADPVENPYQLLETALKAIRSARYILKPYQGGGVDWQEVSRDWRSYNHRLQQAADGVPEALRNDYDPDSSAIGQISRALDLPEQRIADLIEQIAVEAEEKQESHV